MRSISTRESGQAAENEAEKFLIKQGFRTVKRNFTAKTGEIDLIMLRKDLLIFVEVRMRRNTRYGTGAETVTISKQRKIINTAQLFLQKFDNNQWQKFRFDVISIDDKIDWIPAAFTLD